MNCFLPHRFTPARVVLVLVGLLCASLVARAQLPTPTYGWNLGNTLEPPSGEGTWGPAATKALINSVADAGFNTVRIPVAWHSHADPVTHKIDPAWMARVKQVVDWCYQRKLYVIINSHWDTGWLEHSSFAAVDPLINAKQKAYWTQIAKAFKNYNNRLLFAGANEPDVKTAAQMSVLLAYEQTFVKAVRATGGKNKTRWLVVQGPGTDIERTVALMNKLPKDPTRGRLVVEVHYYSPYQYTLMNEDADWGKMAYFWGRGYTHPTRTDRNATWADEAYIDQQFRALASKFVKKGVPVLLGEFQSFKRLNRSDLTGADFQRHVAARTYFHKYVVDAANARGIKPVYWDIAGQMFDWKTGKVTDRDNLRVLTGGAALPPPDTSGVVANGIYKIVARHSGKALSFDKKISGKTSAVRQTKYRRGEQEQWVLHHLGKNTYRIVGLKSGLALEASGAGKKNGTKVRIAPSSGAKHQQWKLTPASGGYFRLTPAHAPTKSLSVQGKSKSEKAKLELKTASSSAKHQQWSLRKP